MGEVGKVASSVRNISTKNYQNLIAGFQVTIKNVGDVFLGHSAVNDYLLSAWWTVVQTTAVMVCRNVKKLTIKQM